MLAEIEIPELPETTLPVDEIVIAQCYRYSCAAYRTPDGRWLSVDDNVELIDVVGFYRI